MHHFATILSRKRPSSTFKSFNLRLITTKNYKNMKNCTIFSPKSPKNDFLTLNWGHPSSCTTIVTWRTTKAHIGPLMKLNARWALPVYPVLKDQSHWKMCEHILKKTQRTNTIQILWIVKNSNQITPVQNKARFCLSLYDKKTLLAQFCHVLVMHLFLEWATSWQVFFWNSLCFPMTCLKFLNDIYILLLLMVYIIFVEYNLKNDSKAAFLLCTWLISKFKNGKIISTRQYMIYQSSHIYSLEKSLKTW